MKRTRPRMNLQAISKFAELADYSFAFAIRAVAAIGVADHMEGKPVHIDLLAELTNCNKSGLARVLRALVTKDVFEEVEPGIFALTEIGDLLRTDHPLSMRWFFRLEPDVQALSHLEYSIKTGDPSFDDIFGKPYFVWLQEKENEKTREKFIKSQKALNEVELLAVTRSYPWAKSKSMVDIGGNDGSMVAALLQKNPELKGTVFDLPNTVEKANRTFDIAQVSDRASAVAGNVFEGNVPAGADLYTIKRMLVGYSDDEAIAVLKQVRKAMTESSRCIILEPTLDTTNQIGLSLDLLMLVSGLGKVRSSQEFANLFDRAGFEVTNTINAGLITFVEAKISSDE